MADKEYILRHDNGLDPHGQPRNRRWNGPRLSDRTIDELLGICKGIISDGTVSSSEAEFLVQWIEKQRAVVDSWPVNVLASRIERMMADHQIDEEERRELFDLLTEIAAGGSAEEVAKNMATALPLTEPAPTITFPQRAFCFTGKFYFGTRHACQQAVVDRGGFVNDNVTLQTHYLVIGYLGSTDWIHSTHGRKIEKAVALSQDRAHPLAIISERHWIGYL